MRIDKSLGIGLEPVRRIRPAFNDTAPQLIRDDWRGTERICRCYGQCVACRRRVYAFDDGENDPRGMLGDHALSTTTLEVPAATYHGLNRDLEVEIITCALCANVQEKARMAQRMALDEIRTKGPFSARSVYEITRGERADVH